jgi:peptide/nickel transport system permease protein
MIPVLIGITIISFIVIHLAPGEPSAVEMQLNPKVSAEARLKLRQYYGLDKPLYEQYYFWLKRFVKLDFGESFSSDHRPVLNKIKERLPVTILINFLSILIIFFVAIPIGVFSVLYRNTLADKITTFVVYFGFATPGFWLALILMYIFGLKLGLLPISGITSVIVPETLAGKVLDVTKHLIIPIFVSAFAGLAGLSRYVRANMFEALSQEYILTARAKGLSEKRVVYVHALKNALLPVVTILGLSVPELIGGSVIFESIFAIPGMGQLFYQSAMMRDYPTIMGILTIGAILTLLGNLMADVSYALVDPRIRIAKRGG